LENADDVLSICATSMGSSFLARADVGVDALPALLSLIAGSGCLGAPFGTGLGVWVRSSTAVRGGRGEDGAEADGGTAVMNAAGALPLGSGSESIARLSIDANRSQLST
jgi:hypothetical protein